MFVPYKWGLRLSFLFFVTFPRGGKVLVVDYSLRPHIRNVYSYHLHDAVASLRARCAWVIGKRDMQCTLKRCARKKFSIFFKTYFLYHSL